MVISHRFPTVGRAQCLQIGRAQARRMHHTRKLAVIGCSLGAPLAFAGRIAGASLGKQSSITLGEPVISDRSCCGQRTGSVALCLIGQVVVRRSTSLAMGDQVALDIIGHRRGSVISNGFAEICRAEPLKAMIGFAFSNPSCLTTQHQQSVEIAISVPLHKLCLTALHLAPMYHVSYWPIKLANSSSGVAEKLVNEYAHRWGCR